MNHADQVIVRAAARILRDAEGSLLDKYDPIGEALGFTGVYAGDAAAELEGFIAQAEKVGYMQVTPESRRVG